MTCVDDKPLNLSALMAHVEHAGAGAIVQFLGTVRNENRGRIVTSLEYEAHRTLAESLITEIVASALGEFEIIRAICVHRVGRLNVGEIAIAALTSSAHRKEAYRANEYIVNRVKHEVPIWKKEYYADGSYLWAPQCEGCASVEHHPDQARV